MLLMDLKKDQNISLYSLQPFLDAQNELLLILSFAAQASTFLNFSDYFFLLEIGHRLQIHYLIRF